MEIISLYGDTEFDEIIRYSQQITKLSVPGYEFDCFRHPKGYSIIRILFPVGVRAGLCAAGIRLRPGLKKSVGAEEGIVSCEALVWHRLVLAQSRLHCHCGLCGPEASLQQRK